MANAITLTTSRITPGQLKLLEQTAIEPTSVVGEQQVRLAESLVFKKWATMDGSIKSRVITLTITSAGRKALDRQRAGTSQST